jgi:hypothetical protein
VPAAGDCGKRIGRTAALGAGSGVVRLDQIDEHFPRHHMLQLGEEFLTFGALVGCGLLVVSESKLLSSHEPSSYLPSHRYCPVNGRVYPRSP